MLNIRRMPLENQPASSGRGLTAHEKAALRIRRQILSGRLKEDAMLPPEPALAASLHISRLTLRAAIAILVEEGLLWWSKATPTLRNAATDLRELIELIQQSRQAAAEKAMEAMCRLREGVYLELAKAEVAG